MRCHLHSIMLRDVVKSLTMMCAVVGVAVGVLTAPAAAQTAIPKARIILTSGSQMNVEVLERVSPNAIKVRDVDSKSEATLQRNDIRSIRFEFDIQRGAIDLAYGDTDFKAVADRLWKELRPILPYADLPVNGPEYFPMLLNALFWTEQYGRINELYPFILRIQDPPLHQLARLYRLLSLIAQDRLLVANEDLKKLQDETTEPAIKPAILYAEARLKAARKEWSPAQRTVAQVIVFHPKDFDWMPPALLLSAQTHMELGRLQVASQILAEVREAYPKKHWIAMADALQKQLDTKMDTAEKEAEKQQAQTERSDAASGSRTGTQPTTPNP